MADSSSSSSSSSIAVSFKSAAVQQEFAQSFQLADSAGASLVQLPLQPPGAPATNDSSSSSGSSFDTGLFFQHLQSARMGHVLLHSPSIPSTQEFMRQHSSCLPEGALLVADQQTKGKGRGGNVWTSPAGCLMFTALKRLQVPGEQAAFINYVVCLAVVLGVKEATQGLLPGGLDVQIKWPNDIYCRGLKIGGALIHTTWSAGKFAVLTGIGINVSNSQPTTCLEDILRDQAAAAGGAGGAAAAAAAAAATRRVCKEQLLASVATHLERCFETFEQRGFEPLRQLYLSSWMHSNQAVRLQDEAVAGGSLELTIQGLSPHGFLLAVDALGQRYELTPDGNSLDMMQGLLKKKL